MEQRKRNITIRLTDMALEVLRVNAAKEHRPVANLIGKIVGDYIESRNGDSDAITVSPGFKSRIDRA